MVKIISFTIQFSEFQKNISKAIVEQEFKAAAKYLKGTLTDSFLHKISKILFLSILIFNVCSIKSSYY